VLVMLTVSIVASRRRGVVQPALILVDRPDGLQPVG
jgi:hypothetical protein